MPRKQRFKPSRKLMPMVPHEPTSPGYPARQPSHVDDGDVEIGVRTRTGEHPIPHGDPEDPR